MADNISHSPETLWERPSTYFLQNQSRQEEIARLELQNKMLTLGTGGVLPELADPTLLRRVLDVGCGTGGWLIEMAKTYPAIKQLVGVDISKTMVRHARQEATAAFLDDRVQFQTMDALAVLDFQTSSFDLVNQRLGASWLRTWEWPKILVEYRRVCRPSGIIRITEGNVVLESNSPALTKLNGITLEAFHRSGRLFEAQSDGLTGRLVHLMTQHGIQDIQAQVHTLVCSAGTNTHQSFYEDAIHFYRVSLPFLQKWVHVPGDYQEIYQQALKEMQAAEFTATWTWLTVWGTRPKGIL